MRRNNLLIAVCTLLTASLSQSSVSLAEETSSSIAVAADLTCTTPTLHTTSGLVCGLVQEVAADGSGSEKAISAFLGIPYAQTTAGDNRWRPPKPIGNWSAELNSDIHEATHFGPSCPQKLATGVKLELSEDCLSVNIWTPVPLKDMTAAEPVPVMVFIYGGSFRDGTSKNPLYGGRHLAASGNVIVVTLNYRVGALGFLSGTEGLKGNYGLMDQRLALGWVRDNISKFGGDPDDVTLFGESAGAMSVGLHLISPDSEPLFKAAILESNPYGIPYKSLKTSKRFAKILKYNLGCTFRGLDCLRAVPFEDVVAKQQSGLLPVASLLTGLSADLIWAPIVDGKQVPAQPNASTIEKPVIIGTNLDEGIIFAASNQTELPDEKKKVLKLDYELMLDVMFSIKTAKRIKEHPRYTPHEGDNTDVFSHVISDYLFTCSNRRVMELAKGPVWAYHFTHAPSYNIWPAIRECAPDKGTVCHAAELPYVFENPDTAEIQATTRDYTFRPDELRLSATVMRYWAQFARRSDPNGEGNPVWAQFTKTKPTRLILDTEISSKTDLGANCALWNEIGYDQPGLLKRIFGFLN